MSTLRQKRRRRMKSAGITLPGNETARQPVSQGARKPAEDPRIVAMSARIKHGVKPDDASLTMAGCEVGRCILALNADASAWALWRHMLAAHWNYCRLVLGTTGQARIGAPGYIPERVETDDNHTVDIRTQEERIEGARRAWGAFSGQIASLPTPMHQWAIRDALAQREGLCWANGRPTARGKLVVAALGLMGAKEKRE